MSLRCPFGFLVDPSLLPSSPDLRDCASFLLLLLGQTLGTVPLSSFLLLGQTLGTVPLIILVSPLLFSSREPVNMPFTIERAPFMDIIRYILMMLIAGVLEGRVRASDEAKAFLRTAASTAIGRDQIIDTILNSVQPHVLDLYIASQNDNWAGASDLYVLLLLFLVTKLACVFNFKT